MPDIDIVINGKDNSSGAINSAEKSLNSLEGAATSATGKFGLLSSAGATLSHGFSGLQDVVKVGLTGAFVGGTLAVGGLVAAFGDSVSQARESVNASNQLAAVIKSTGGAAGVTSEHAKDLASSLQLVTNFGDEATVGAESMLLTFTNIGSSGGVFDRATKTALDMSQALGQDLKSSSIQLGKALNDPINGVTALQRVGVTFNETQKDTIKTMVEAGNTAGAQGLILDELAKEFGGSAEAMADPAIVLQNAFGELKEAIGMGLLPIIDSLAQKAMPLLAQATTLVGGAMADFTAMMKNNESALDIFSTVIGDLIPADWVDTWIDINTQFNNFITLSTNIINAIQTILGPIVEAVTNFVSWKDVLGALGIVISSIVIPALDSFIVAATPIIATAVLLVTGIAALRTAWESDFLGIRTAVETAWAAISPILEEWILNINGVWEAFKVNWALVSDANTSLGDKLNVVWSSIKTLFGDTWHYIGELIGTLLPPFVAKLKEWGAALWQWIVDAVPVVLHQLGEWSGQILNWVVAALPGMISAFLEWETALYQWIDDTLPKAIESLAKFIGGLREKGEGDGNATFTGMVSSWSDKLWRWIQDDLIPAAGPAFTKFIGTLSRLGQDLLSSLGLLATELGKTLWQWIVDITPTAKLKLAEWGGDLMDWIKTNAPVWYDYLKDWANRAWQWIKDIAIPEALKKLDEWGAALWGWVKDNAPKWEEQLKEWGRMAWAWITDTAIPEALKKLDEWFTDIKDWLTTNWPKWRDNLTQSGKDAMQWLQDGIEDGWNKARNWFFSDTAFGRFVGDIKDMMGIQLGNYGVFNDHGKNIVYSLNEGSRFGLPALQQTGGDMGDALSSGLQEAMDMHSPSRRMFGYGQDITAGLGNGIVDAFGSLTETVRTRVDEFGDTMRTYLDQAGQSMAHSIGDGLKSEAQYIADQVKSAMDLANATLQGQIDTMNRQAAVKAQQSYLAAVAAASSPANVAAALKASGINPALIPASLGGTGKVIGTGPNGGLIMEGAGNKLPASFLPPPPPTSSPDAVATTQGITKTLADALGIVKGIVPVVTQTATLLGGINLSVTDINPAETKLRETVSNAVTSTFSGISSIFSSDKLSTLFSGQDYNMQTALASLMNSVGNTLSHAADTAGRVVDTAGFKDVMNGLLTSLTDTITGAANGSTFSGDTDVQKWFSGLIKELTSTIKAGITSEASAAKVTDPLGDFIKGVSAFLKDTLTKAQTVIQTDAISQNSALINGTLSSYLGSATHQKIVALGSSLKGIQQSFADILGVSVNDLNVTSTDSPQLLDRIKSVIKNTNGDTSFDAIQALLQSAVNFRSTANSTGINYYANVLPTDPRLTGQAAAANTTNNFTIQMQGSSSASADVASMVQLLGSLYGTAAP